MLQGVVLADINSEIGTKTQEDLEKIFGINKCLFVKTDVSDFNQFEGMYFESNAYLINMSLSDAFKKAIEHFGGIDILFNNAGIGNGRQWEKEISVHLVRNKFSLFCRK